MKSRSMLFRLLLILFIVSLALTHSNAQEPGSVGTSSSTSKDEFSLGSATDLLKPPNTASPRATMKSFIENMNRAYSELMKAHRKNIKSPGLFSSKSAIKIAEHAEELFQSSVECLNLSEIPKGLKKNKGYEGAIMLKEVFDRIDLPPYEEVPDDKAIEAESDSERRAELIRWRIPNTDIIIDRVEEGPREGEFLFTPETVARIREFYGKVRDFPYKLNAQVSHDFYNFYSTSAGSLLPPKWNSWLPAWTTYTYLYQTIWQWFALITLPLSVFLTIWMIVRWWFQRTAELSSGKKTTGWLLIFLGTIVLVSLTKYILDEHVNITGAVLYFLEHTLLRVFILFLVVIILWEFIKSQVKEKMESTEEDMNGGEEGGAGGSRGETLLILLRKTLLAFMFAIVFLLLLSSMGINIGPLLAGAGVIGLAIGFGAQTLVKDILSGIFFLVDDAFRVGDYIETSGMKGTVEHISIRSLRLRSPRGPVHTIPFGSMDTVTNNSRDYIISKLDFRVRYDTNVDKVRKIIKKINKKIKKDDKMGPVLLSKVKSQGVRELDDSAMIMRVKFKTIPGEQFVIRREVFRMMQEAFRENGIEFAHRNVTVYMPPEQSDETPDKKAVEAAAAAAAAAEQAEAKGKEPK